MIGIGIGIAITTATGATIADTSGAVVIGGIGSGTAITATAAASAHGAIGERRAPPRRVHAFANKGSRHYDRSARLNRQVFLL